ncbi:tetraacyldisaccharide 4'-kinase [Flavobacteriaceae bacterium]|nr:tetraacyldisaccharide 4'-kinase [Flavobacteriaceae bacterium]MDG1681931.1 tetraacyldisaccharide 4'-kinase [Flavobacteriaceae bacterium]RZP00490.1 MAG: tetraacyldisaccharide 4'-kinase [Flavobacteriales bacterium]
MKLFRKLLFFLTPLYYLITVVRNILYDLSFYKTTKFQVPTIGIGNLAVGGTGKSPMVEYLIDLLSNKYSIATLSRGYGRNTKSFIIANEKSTHSDIGDEPLQFYNKYNNIIVCVDNNRVNGINNLLQINKPPSVILLDDCFQHRKLTLGLSILLTDYSNLFSNDYVLPFGNLREPASSSRRADIVIVTKCPKNIDEIRKNKIKNKLNLKLSQKLFFSSIEYSKSVIFNNTKTQFNNFIKDKFILVTGLASSDHIVDYLSNNKCDFEHKEFNDHHDYILKDFEKVNPSLNILTTEKDYAKLIKILPKRKIYYLPITVNIDSNKLFDKLILDYCNN